MTETMNGHKTENGYRKEVFRAAVVNHDYRSPRSYARDNKLSLTGVNRVWNGDLNVTISKLIETIAPLGLTTSEMFAPEDANGGKHLDG